MTTSDRPNGCRARPRRGVTPVEVLVVVAVLFLVLMTVLLSLPRMRERARMTSCQRNLGQIGVALALYDGAEGSLPFVPELTARSPGSGPLATLLASLAVPDLTELDETAKPTPRRASEAPLERRIPGFLCPSDANSAGPDSFPAPVSYRATTGDAPGGLDGGFAPGRRLSLSEVEAGDGKAFTAAFSERLFGTGKDGEPGPRDYRSVAGPIGNAPCPAGGPGGWKGDAGRSWAEATWRSSLYNHTRMPNQAATCVASDGATASTGASSAHAAGVNVLMCDGRVRTVSPTIGLPIWQGLGTTHGPAPRPVAVPPEPE